MMKRVVVPAVVTPLVLLSTAWGAFTLSKSRTHQLFAELITRAETPDSVVALTFDDGPVPFFTDSVLATLDEFDAEATFFVVGAGVQRNPDLAREIVARGHDLANHSFRHDPLLLKSPSFIRREIEATDALIRAAGHEGDIYVRPPYGKRLIGLPLYLRSRDRPVVLWDLEPDTYHAHADGMTWHVLENVRPGSIILLHVEIPSRTEERSALREILSALRARGYRFVTLTELLQDGGRRPMTSAPSAER